MSRFVLTAQLQLQAPNNVAQVVRQIQSQLNNVSVNVQVQGAAQAQRQLQQVTAHTQAATTAADRMGRAFAMSIRRFAAFSIATRAVGLFTSTLSDAVQTAIDFERQMIKISQVTGDSMAKLKGLTKAITDLSTGFGVSSQSLLEASTLLLQAGISAKDTEVALKTLAKAALAPNFDSLSETTEGAIAILAQFGEGVNALEKQLGSINAVAGAFAVEASDLMDVIRRTGGVFKSSGGSLNELIALFTSVRATTRESAESIGTGLRTIFTRIQRPKTIEFLKQFGVELVDMEGKFVGPYEAVQKLSAALAGLGERDITFIRIAEELGGFRQIGKVLPLLQQFTVAQNALNVANKSGNSLTNDAASAQQALAIRITKVKEEFLALVRGMTETKTFQLMANTALSLASALIKMAESIKPLLPMLTALMGIKLVKGLGGFLGGMSRGMASGRTYSTGGKVHHFARGGVVPGVGNRDTVPAMLQPGEFVIKKSSVNKIGADNLSSMNHYAAGGRVQNDKFAYGQAISANIYKKAKASIPESRWRKMSQAERDQVAASLANDMSKPKKTTKKQAEKLAKERRGILDKYPGGAFTTRPGAIGGFFLTPERGNDGQYSLPTTKEFMLNNQKAALLSGSKINNYVPFRNDLKANSQLTSIIDNSAKLGIKNAVINASDQVANFLSLPSIQLNKRNIKNAANKVASDKQVFSTIGGYMYEGIIQGITGAKLAGGQTSFDYPTLGQLEKSKLGSLFGSNASVSGLIKADAKRSLNSKMNDSIFDKVVNGIVAGDMRGVKRLGEISTDKIGRSRKSKMQRVGMASGGGVGTDTVPALLTPGEFVVNRSSAQRIGYGNLNRMNKVGRYASGGIVQRFAKGTSGTGAKPKGDIIFEQAVLRNLPAAERSLTKFATGLDKLMLGGFDKLAIGLDHIYASMRGVTPPMKRMATNLAFLDSYVPGFSKIIQENSSVNKRAVTNQIMLIDAIVKKIDSLYNSGKSDAQVEAAAKKYAQAIAKNTSMLQGGATLPQLSGSATKKPASTGSPASTSATTTNNTSRTSARSTGAVGMLQDNKMFAASMAASMVQGFLPAINENSGALLKLSHAFLGMITTITSVGFALEAFGLKLSKQGIKDFITGGSKNGNMLSQKLGLNRSAISQRASFLRSPQGGNLKSFAALKQAATQSKAGTIFNAPGVSKFTASLGRATQVIGKFAGPVLAAAAATYGIIKASNALITAFYDVSLKLKSAIEVGDVNKAADLAGKQYDLEAANTTRAVFGTGGGVIGGAIGSIFGPMGTVIGAAIGAAAGVAIGTVLANVAPGWAEAINIAFGGNTRDSAVKLAAAQAGAVKTQKDLDQAQKSATMAMQDFENGSITASEALARINAATAGVVDQEKRASDFAESNRKNRGGMFRDVMTLGGILGENSETRNQRLGKESADQIRQASRFSAQAFQIGTAGRTAAIRSNLFRGTKSKEEIRQEALGGPGKNNLIARRDAAVEDARKALIAKDEEAYQAAIESARQFNEQIQQVDREIENLGKEIEIAKAQFNALNLGLRSVTAAADASALRMSKAMNSFDLAVVPGTNAIATLEAALTAAGQNISQGEFDSALADVSGILKKFGANAQQVGKFEGLAKGVATVQREFPNIFDTLKGRLEKGELRGMSPEDLGKEFKKIVGESLDKAGIGEAAKKQIMDGFGNVKIDEEDMAKILAGDVSVLEKYLGAAAEEVSKNIKAFGEKWISANQELIKATQERIEAERNLVAAQREAIDLYMEGRDIQAKYGGQAVSTAERRGAILAKANAGAARNGLGQMRTGSIAELRARNNQIATGFGAIEARRGGPNSEMGAAGADLQGTQQNLQQAQKDQIQTIRDLIKLEEEELKIIQEKNRMEKESLESLITGDIEKFFEQQAAIGAQAAIATGDANAANMFGPKAVAMAFQDIQRQQEAGVQTLFGRQLGGPGGLAEQAAGAALGARGVMDPRMAQRLAGTTAEEEATKGRLRELGGLLGETGAIGAAMAEMQVQTAQMKINQAQLVIDNLEFGGAPAQGKASGGLIYANRGMFVPRGTDTVPAMLTPGEFVVRREAVNRDNNLQLLRSINSGGSAEGLARGGKVGYYNNGGMVQYKFLGDLIKNAGGALGIDPQMITNLGNVFKSFTTSFADSIKNLQDTKLQVKLDSVNVNVNLTGTSMLTQISEETRTDIIKQVINKLRNEYGVGSNGKLTENTSNLARPGQGQ